MTELDSRPKRPSHNRPRRLMKECGSKVRLIVSLRTLQFEANFFAENLHFGLAVTGLVTTKFVFRPDP